MIWIVLAVSLVARFKTISKKFTFFGIAQDLFVALELSLLPRFLAIPLAAFGTVYIILDALVFEQLRTRMHPSYFALLKQARSFLDSAVALGLKKFVGLTVPILVAIFLSPTMPFSWQAFFLLVVSGGIGFAGASYKRDNAFFSLHLYPLKFLRKRKDELLGLPRFLIPPSEKADYVSPMFPLLKVTHGFEGVKQFDIPIDKGRPPHIIFLMLESFRGKDVNGRVTPFFEKLKKEGVYFSQFYSNGVLTHQAVIATLFGIYPFFGSFRREAIFDEPRHRVDFSTLPLIGIGDLLQKKGYRTGYIDAALCLESEKRFFQDHGFETVVGRDDFSTTDATSWGVFDKKLVEYGLSYLNHHWSKNQPTFTVLFTVSNHHPWQSPPDYAFDSFDDIGDPIYQKFLKTMRYTDSCLERFITPLKQENVVVFILGDHGQGMGEHGLDRFQNSVYEENIHIPLVIWAPGKITAPLEIDTVSSQIDLLPTIFDLLNLKGLNHAMGKSLLREVAMPSFYNNSHIGFSLGCRLGPYKYVYSDLLESKRELFDVSRDPDEREDITASLPEISKEYEAMTHACYRFMYGLYERGNFTLNRQQVVDCSAMREITETQLVDILDSVGKPHTLNLKGCLSLTDKTLQLVLPYASNLCHLDLTDCLISSKAVDKFLKDTPHLQHLHLTHCPLISSDEIEALTRSHSNVKIYSIVD